MRLKHVPLRTCIACSKMKPKNELIRISKSNDECKKEPIIDVVGKARGRGAYVCKNINCVKTLKKSHKLERLLSQKFPEEFYEKLEEAVSEVEK